MMIPDMTANENAGSARAWLVWVCVLLLGLVPVRAGTLVQGRVTGQDERGEYLGPLEGAVIEVRRGDAAAVTATADEFGSYRLEDLPAGEYRYRITAEGFATEDVGRGFALQETSEGLVLDFILTKGESDVGKAAELAGHVWRGNDGDKSPLAGATVAVRQESGGPAFLAESGADGGYRISLPAGRWQVSARHGDAAPVLHDVPVVLEAGEKETVDFTFDAPAAEAAGVDEAPAGVHGMVTSQDEEGEHLGVLAGARVEFLKADGRPAGAAETDEFGYYRIENLEPGRFTYRLSAEDHQTDDSGRGVEITRRASMEVLDFILTKGSGKDAEIGRIEGRVAILEGGREVGVADAPVFFTRDADTRAMVSTDEDGAYSIEVASGEWRASAVVDGFPPQPKDEAVKVVAGEVAKADFVFKPSPVGEVRALVTVERSEAGKAAVPELSFVCEDSGERIAGEVKALSDEDMHAQGIDPGGFRKDRWSWFVARPSAEMVEGTYRAEAGAEGCRPDRTAPKTTAAGRSTWFDVVLAREPDGTGPTEHMAGRPGNSRVEGTVTGQTDQAEHDGPVVGATVELFTHGRRAGSARTDEHGFYRIEKLGPGAYTYRVTGPPYATDDSGRGFVVPKDAEAYVLDIILCRETQKMEEPATLAGHLWQHDGETKEPVAGGTVIAVAEGSNTPARTTTDADGMYELKLPPGNWRVAATVGELGSRTHPESVALAPGAGERIDFDFTMPQPGEPEVYVLVAVERLPDEEGDDPEVRLLCTCDGSEIGDLQLQPLGGDPRGSEFFKEFGLELDQEDLGRWQWFLARPAEGVEVMPGVYRAKGKLEGYLDPDSGLKTVSAESPVILDLVFERVRPEVEVLVEDSGGKPLDDVRIRFINKTLGGSFVDATKGGTGKDGRLEIVLDDGLGEYEVTFNLGGFDPQVRSLVADRKRLEMKVTLFREGETPRADLAGTVVEMKKGGSEAGDGVVSARLVFVAGEGQLLPPALEGPITTGPDGSFSVPNVDVGTYAYELSAEGFKPGEGQVTVKIGMEPVVLTLEPVNRMFEDHIRRLLTSGWGPSGTSNATRYYGMAVNEDPGDCRADYAKALAELSTDSVWAGNVSGGVEPEVAVGNASKFFSRAVKKKDRGIFWDRACEGAVWSQLHTGKSAAATATIQLLCEGEYATREPSEASKETVYLFGLSMGFLMGPGSTPATAAGYRDIDAACVKALQDPHRAEYLRGRDSISKQLGELAQEHEDERRKIAEGEAAEQAANAEKALARIREIDRELDGLEAELEGHVGRFNQRWGGLNPNAAQAEIVRIQQRIRQLQLLRGQPTRGCAECGTYNPTCPSCQAAHQQSGMQVDLEIRQLQMRLGNLQLQMNRDREIYDREWRELDATKRRLETEIRRLEQERRRHAGEVDGAPDIKGMIDRMDRDFEEGRKEFSSYWDIDHEKRKKELLDSLGR